MQKVEISEKSQFLRCWRGILGALVKAWTTMTAKAHESWQAFEVRMAMT